jgi:protein TonB
MTDLVFSSFEAAPPSPAPAPIKPPWLRPASLAAVLGAHVTLAWLLLGATAPTVASLETVSLDLVPEGDYFESQEVTAAEEEPPPPEEIEQPDLALPPPEVMSPEAPPLPVKKEIVEQKKKKIVEKKRDVDYAEKRREAQAQRRMGAPEGRAGASGMSQSAYKALLHAAIMRRVPATTAAGEGTASVSFHVTASGAITGISVTGSTPAHAALARRIIASVHAPPPPDGAFFASQNFHFH